MSRLFTIAATVALVAGCVEPASLPPLPEVSTVGLQQPVAEVIAQARAAVGAAPGDADANGRLAMLLHVHDRNEAAAAVYERARALAPDSLRWAYLHGDALERAGRTAEATDAFRAALAIEPGYARARVRLADMLSRAGDAAAARQHYEAVMAQAPQRADALFGYGQLLNNSGEHAAATAALHRVLDASGDSGPVHYALAQAYQRGGDSAAAERHRQAFERDRDKRIPVDDPLLEQALSLRAGDRPDIERAERLYAAGDLAGARAAFERALRINPDSAIAHANLVGVAGALGDLEQARTHYQRAVALDPGVAIAHSNYGTVLLKAGRPAMAEEALRRAADIDRADAGTAANLGFAVELQQRHEEAESIYREALRRDSGHAFANYLLGRRLLDSGQGQSAIALLERSAAVESPHRLRALFALARARRENGDVGDALETLREAHTLANSAGNYPLAAQISAEIASWEASGE